MSKFKCFDNYFIFKILNFLRLIPTPILIRIKTILSLILECQLAIKFINTIFINNV